MNRWGECPRRDGGCEMSLVKQSFWDRLFLGVSLSFLAATVVWFMFWADPADRGQWFWWDSVSATVDPSTPTVADSSLDGGDLADDVPTASINASSEGLKTSDLQLAAPVTAGVTGPAGVTGVALRRPHFELSTACALCHAESTRAAAMRDSAGNSVAPFDLWQSSMMAQSARDPYWRAVLSAEVHATPNEKAHLEDVCTRCHAPMSHPIETSPDGQILAFLESSPIAGAQKVADAQLGLDGVSCTVCHQMTDKNFGEYASFTGGFEINTDSLIYGPHADPFTMPMQRHVDYTPTHGQHVLKSALCATCHTVITEAVTPEGEMTEKVFHEQTPYLEWRNSVFNDEVAQPAPEAQSCQSCHMPTQDDAGQAISTALAHNPGGRDFPFLEPRSPFGRHTLVGGNAFMTRLIRDNADALGVRVPRAAFDASLAAIGSMLRDRTASVEIEGVQLDGQWLQWEVKVLNKTGHKLPTAYPSRRVWLRVQVTDPSGKTVFLSGDFNDRGQLVDAAGAVLPSEVAAGPILEHRNEILSDQQVQIYETVMGDTQGHPTFYLLRGASFIKDNRILPKGWRSDHPDATATMPQGIAQDGDFSSGQDRVRYRIPLPTSERARIEVALYYQPISPRHAAELFLNPTEDVRRFQTMYEAADHRPALIDRQVADWAK